MKYLRYISKISSLADSLVAKVKMWTIDKTESSRDVILTFPAGLISIDETDVIFVNQDNQGQFYGTQTWIKKARDLKEQYNLTSGDKLFGIDKSVIIARKNGKIEIKNNDTEIVLDEKIEIKNNSTTLKAIINNILTNNATLLNGLKNTTVLNPINGKYELPLDPNILGIITTCISNNTQTITLLESLLK